MNGRSIDEWKIDQQQIATCLKNYQHESYAKICRKTGAAFDDALALQFETADDTDEKISGSFDFFPPGCSSKKDGSKPHFNSNSNSIQGYKALHAICRNENGEGKDGKNSVQKLFDSPPTLNIGKLGSARAPEDRCRYLPFAEGFVCKGVTGSNIRQVHIHKGQGGAGYSGPGHGSTISWITKRNDNPNFSDWSRANDLHAVDGSPEDESNYPLYLTNKFGGKDLVLTNKYTSNNEMFGSDMQSLNLLTGSTSDSMPVYKLETVITLHPQKVKFVCEDPRCGKARWDNARMNRCSQSACFDAAVKSLKTLDFPGKKKGQTLTVADLTRPNLQIVNANIPIGCSMKTENGNLTVFWNTRPAKSVTVRNMWQEWGTHNPEKYQMIECTNNALGPGLDFGVGTPNGPYGFAPKNKMRHPWKSKTGTTGYTYENGLGPSHYATCHDDQCGIWIRQELGSTFDYESLGAIDGWLIPKESPGFDQRHCFFFNRRERDGGTAQSRHDSSKCQMYNKPGQGFDSITFARADWSANQKSMSQHDLAHMPGAVNDVKAMNGFGGWMPSCQTKTWYPTRPAMNMADLMLLEIPPSIPDAPHSYLKNYTLAPPNQNEGVKIKMEVPGGLLVRLVRAPSYLQQTLDQPYKVPVHWGTPSKDSFSQGKRLDTSQCDGYAKLTVEPGVRSTFKPETEETRNAKVIGGDWGTYNCVSGELTVAITGTTVVQVETVICNGHGEWGQDPIYTCVCHEGWGGETCGEFQDPCADNAAGNYYWAELFVNNPFLRETPLMSKCVATPSLSKDDIALAKKRPWKMPSGEMLTDTSVSSRYPANDNSNFPSMHFRFSYSARFTASLKNVAKDAKTVTAYAEADTGFRLMVDNDVLINEWYVGLLSEGQPGWRRSAVATWAEPTHQADIKTKMRSIRRGSVDINVETTKDNSVVSLEYYYASNKPSNRPHVSLSLKTKENYSPAVPGTLLGCISRDVLEGGVIVKIVRKRERVFEDGFDFVPDGVTADRCMTACVGYEMALLSSKKDECRCFKDSVAFLEAHSKTTLEQCRAKETLRPPCSGDTRLNTCGSSTEADVYLVAEHGQAGTIETHPKECPVDMRFEYFRFDGSHLEECTTFEYLGCYADNSAHVMKITVPRNAGVNGDLSKCASVCEHQHNAPFMGMQHGTCYCDHGNSFATLGKIDDKKCMQTSAQHGKYGGGNNANAVYRLDDVPVTHPRCSDTPMMCNIRGWFARPMMIDGTF